MNYFFSRCSRAPSVDDEEMAYPLATEPIRNAAFIPLRLTMPQRKSQRLMRAIMLASNYTNKVDAKTIDAAKRSHIIAKEVTNALIGFVTALKIESAAELLTKRSFPDYKSEISDCVEACRRYKIMNPDLLRTDYVKFLYFLQDAMSENMRDVLGFEIVRPILTVGSYLERLKVASGLLADKDLPLAITPVPKFEKRHVQNAALRRKDVLVDDLCKRYGREVGVKSDTIEIAVRSLNDANNFANNNCESAGVLIDLLTTYFNPKEHTSLSTLAISEGTEGSRLTHEHERQYLYVLQSLSLWKNISRQMFSLWVIAEEDLLDPANPYELRETGQGIQRVQKAPRLYKAVKTILEETKAELGAWVGLETIHLGDDQVPNAFHFIDKYGQISRILVPILRTIEKIEELKKDTEKDEYLKEVFGGAHNAKVAVLRDFFRRGFDGSGGDTLEDAGSCVDGRLTSAWNWCNTIREKPFYPLFLMAGFTSFDGDLSL